MSIETETPTDKPKKKKTKRKFRGFEFNPDNLCYSMKKKLAEYEKDKK